MRGRACNALHGAVKRSTCVRSRCAPDGVEGGRASFLTGPTRQTILTRRERDGSSAAMGEPPGQTRDATRVDRPRPEDAGGEPSALLELERFMPYRLSVVSSRISGSLAREYQVRF